MGQEQEYHAVYCVSCLTGYEEVTAQKLRHEDDVTVLAPVKLKKEWRHGGWQQIEKALVPGYVFLYSHVPLQYPEAVKRYHLHVLTYGDGQSALAGNDLRFADWIWRNHGLLGISKAFCDGAVVKIVEGPLRESGGVITRVDKRKQIAQVALDIGSLKVWLSFDYIQERSVQRLAAAQYAQP